MREGVGRDVEEMREGGGVGRGRDVHSFVHTHASPIQRRSEGGGMPGSPHPRHPPCARPAHVPELSLSSPNNQHDHCTRSSRISTNTQSPMDHTHHHSAQRMEETAGSARSASDDLGG